MKTNDILLYGGAAAALYFLVLKPKTPALAISPSGQSATPISPVNATGLAANAKNSTLPGILATQGVSFVQSIAKIFAPQNNTPLVLPVSTPNNVLAMPENSASLLVGQPANVVTPVYSQLQTDPQATVDQNGFYNGTGMYDPYNFDSSTLAGAKCAYLSTL